MWLWQCKISDRADNEDRSIMYDFADFKEMTKLEGLFPDIENLYVR